MIILGIMIVLSVIYVAGCYILGNGFSLYNAAPIFIIWGLYALVELIRNIKDSFKDDDSEDKGSEGKTKESRIKQSEVKYNKNDCEEDTVLEKVLNVFFSFKDKYPDKVVSLHINQSRSIHNYIAFDVCFFLDGKMEFYKSEEADELLKFFSLTEDDGKFQTYEYTRNTYIQPKNTDNIDMQLKSHIKHYMSQYPTRVFDLSKNGAVIRFW